MKILACALLLFTGLCSAQKLAITFDDLPLNGQLPAGVTRTQITHDVLAILKKRHIPPAYGFINAAKLENSAPKDNDDGAEALKLWASREPVGNHTYTHINLSESTVEQFEQDIQQNEPALALLTSNKSKFKNWHWFRYPYLVEGDTVEKRRAIRDFLAKRNYKIAQVTIDWEDYLWNTAYARCLDKHDTQAIASLRTSYLSTASTYIDSDREMAKLIYGHDINHVVLLHLGAFSSTILPDMFALLKKKGFTLTTLEDAESDPAYATDPDIGLKDGGSLLEQIIESKKLTFTYPPAKPYKELKEICTKP